MSLPARQDLRAVLRRALRSRCPRCGEGRIYSGWVHLKDHCERCGLTLAARQPDAWFAIYLSTAALTGAGILIVLLLGFGRMPLAARLAAACAGCAVIVATLPVRKSLAVAIDYWSCRDPRASS